MALSVFFFFPSFKDFSPLYNWLLKSFQNGYKDTKTFILVIPKFTLGYCIETSGILHSVLVTDTYLNSGIKDAENFRLGAILLRDLSGGLRMIDNTGRQSRYSGKVPSHHPGPKVRSNHLKEHKKKRTTIHYIFVLRVEDRF